MGEGRLRTSFLVDSGVPCDNPNPFSPQPQQELIMASKPEKRVASSVFITLAPPRRDVAVTEEVGQAACEARRARPWETLPTKTPGAAVGRSPKTWAPPGRSNASLPGAPPQLSNGGKRGSRRGRGQSSTKAGRKGQARSLSALRVPGRLRNPPACS